jgi:hypothetical protein
VDFLQSECSIHYFGWSNQGPGALNDDFAGPMGLDYVIFKDNAQSLQKHKHW